MAETGTRKGNRVKIVDAALANFARHGYHGASIRKIAQECELNVPSIYYHFKNKETLFRIVLFETHERAMEEVRPQVNSSGSLMDEVSSIFDAILRHHVRNPHRTRMIFRMVYSAPDEICDEWAETRGKEYRELIIQAFLRNRPPHEAKRKLNCIIDTLESFLLSLSFPNRKTDRAPIYARSIDYILG